MSARARLLIAAAVVGLLASLGPIMKPSPSVEAAPVEPPRLHPARVVTPGSAT